MGTSAAIIGNVLYPAYSSIGSAGGYSFFPGNIGAVHFYNRALNITEINQNFTALRGRYGI
jgi:hypothetical protein